jgi:predicted nuclease of predicted toxin-antitoxin system
VATPAGAARTLKLLLDEMHAPLAADALRADGHDVVAVAATPALRGTSDEDLLTYAAAHGLIIVTENVVDFAAIASAWAMEGRPHAGLIFTSPKRFNRATLAYPGNLMVALRALLGNPPDIGASGTWWLS